MRHDNGDNPPLPKGGKGRLPLIAEYGQVLDIQKSYNRHYPDQPIAENGDIDTKMAEALYRRFGDVRGLAKADMDDPARGKLHEMPPELRAHIIKHQSNFGSGRYTPPGMAVSHANAIDPAAAIGAGRDVPDLKGAFGASGTPSIFDYLVRQGAIPDPGPSRIHVQAENATSPEPGPDAAIAAPTPTGPRPPTLN